MATSSLSTIVFSPLALSNSSSFPNKPQVSNLSLHSSLSNLRRTLSHSSPSSSSSSNVRVFAAPEVLESQETGPESYVEEGSETSALGIGADSDQMAPKQKIRIKLRSYWVPLIEDSCKQIMDAARTTNAKTMGPVPLPTKKRIFCVLKSPHVHKDARFHFEIRTHQRLIDILYPTAQTIDSLMQLDLPAGVDVEVKL
uniref:Small ribosomal subunit protein uS10c n=1 Tax=Mesembryanthemum crystallinum TaxID=3544 RepID=RR10_MESCR|nr:RecName: Full=Small ribosomal subunit protein uS10c; AltName: Full=30S ribosomal protein S10, chloroplastic; Flags: Precursor [Mesembryanthemum crystallinum]AAF64190.1 plastid ribosomal protein S10 precursor [Mesembryanthemum crystallinum]4V61_AJ Chain AJ, Ribosomal Protein S10 [Spinacia oleracea]